MRNLVILCLLAQSGLLFAAEKTVLLSVPKYELPCVSDYGKEKSAKS